MHVGHPWSVSYGIMLLVAGILVTMPALAGTKPSNKPTLSKEAIKCDTLTAYPNDPKRRAPAVDTDDVRVDEAVKACTLALLENPGDPVLEFQLGRALYLSGQKKEALDYVRSAAKKQYPQAFCGVGAEYLEAHNEGEAYRWFERGAELGASDCQFMIGQRYLLDTKEYEKARYWLEKAQKQGHPGAPKALAKLETRQRPGQEREGTHSQKPATSTPSQTAPSEFAARCDKLAADPFDPRRRGAPLLGAKYSANLITQAVKTCTLALEQNPDDLVLQYQLGQALYRAGQKNEGANYMLSAAKKQYPQAFCTIGGIYLQANKKGDSSASQYLPVKNVEDALYLPIKNEGEAYHWVEQGAKLGASDCKVILGRKYLLDTKEYTKARYWLEEAEKQGNSNVRVWLAELRKVNPTAQESRDEQDRQKERRQQQAGEAADRARRQRDFEEAVQRQRRIDAEQRQRDVEQRQRGSGW